MFKNKCGTTILFLILVGSCCNPNNASSRHVRAQSSSAAQSRAAAGVVRRLIPNSAYLFDVSVDFELGAYDKSTFKILKTNSIAKVTIVGNSGVSATRGFYNYLNNYCLGHVAWEGTQLSLPEHLPEVNITVTAKERYRYFQNVCTFSYSYAWWSWRQWRAHLDWLALQGVNLVLAPAQEHVWLRAYERLGLNHTEATNVLAGPPFLAWQRMGNIGPWGGPPSEAWLDKQKKLQRKLLRKLNDLGIVVALPTFAGHVPVAINRLFSDSNMQKLPRWNGFSDEYAAGYFLDPSDPLFDRISSIFHEELAVAYPATAISGVYFADPFNEIVPSGGADYVRRVAGELHSTLARRDPNAVWLLQAWMFVHDPYWTDDRIKSFLTAIPVGQLLVLDLQAEQNPQFKRTNYFHGHDFIWCALHNFGGTLGLFGQTTSVNQGISDARAAVGSGAHLVGIGGTPEGINQNYVLYELLYTLAWSTSNEPENLSNWVQQYATRRYGKANDFADKAWEILIGSVYNYEGKERMRGKYTYNRRPSLKIRPWHWYNASDVNHAWVALLNASTELANSDLYQHDLVDVTRQALQQIADQIYIKILSYYRRNDLNLLTKATDNFLNLLDDIEEILATTQKFMLAAWLEDAKSRATNAQERDRFEFNARNQITLWGPNGEIVDYANKQWSGIVADYFKPRWVIFFEELRLAVRNNVTLDESMVQTRIFKEAEELFTKSKKTYPMQPIGNTIDASKRLYARWIINFGRSENLRIVPRISSRMARQT